MPMFRDRPEERVQHCESPQDPLCPVSECLRCRATARVFFFQNLFLQSISIIALTRSSLQDYFFPSYSVCFESKGPHFLKIDQPGTANY